nr:hypothetical protein [Pseudoxanthomonas sp.]
MAERKPVVLVGGQLKELPAGDTLPPQAPSAHSHATSDVTGLDAALSGKEPAISTGSTSQYWRGDKSWRDFFTDVRAATLTGLSTATNAAIAATDTLLAALGKLQAQVSDNAANMVKRLDVGASPAQVPAGQHLGKLAYMDELASLRATLTQPQAIGAVWVERVSDTSIKLFMRGSDGVARSTTLTLS